MQARGTKDIIRSQANAEITSWLLSTWVTEITGVLSNPMFSKSNSSADKNNSNIFYCACLSSF